MPNLYVIAGPNGAGKTTFAKEFLPMVDIRRRFKRSWQNFISLYKPLANSWILFDNAGLKPVEIVKCNQGKVQILNNALYKEMMEEANGKS